MKKNQGNIFINSTFGGYASFIRDVLAKLCAAFPLDGASFYEYDARYRLLHLRVCNSGGFSYDHEDHIRPVPNTPVFRALETMNPVAASLPCGLHLYYPFSFESGEISEDNYEKTKNVQARVGLVRMERRLGHKPFSPEEINEISFFMESHLVSYYRYEYASLLKTHKTNLRAVTSLAEVFAKSLNKQSRIAGGEDSTVAQEKDDSLRAILSGVQMQFGFDRVRLFLIDRKDRQGGSDFAGPDMLRGELSVDITGKVKDLSLEQIPLEPGFHRFADIILNRTPEAFLDKYKDYIAYVPLVVGGETIGLMIGDNFTSLQPIDRQELALLRSIGTQMALAVHNIKLFKKVQSMAKYDALTRLPLRTYFDERLQEEAMRSIRYGHKLSFMFVDIDLFKEINDRYSHRIGDEVLKAVANTVMKTIRTKIDFPGRFGGDEMVIFLPQSSSRDAKGLAERLKKAIDSLRIDAGDGRIIKVSVSMGIATMPDDGDTIEILKNNADLALYWVKEHGRNGFKSYSTLEPGYAEVRARREAMKKPGTR